MEWLGTCGNGPTPVAGARQIALPDIIVIGESLARFQQASRFDNIGRLLPDTGPSWFRVSGLFNLTEPRP